MTTFRKLPKDAPISAVKKANTHKTNDNILTQNLLSEIKRSITDSESLQGSLASKSRPEHTQQANTFLSETISVLRSRKQDH